MPGISTIRFFPELTLIFKICTTLKFQLQDLFVIVVVVVGHMVLSTEQSMVLDELEGSRDIL